MRILVTGASGFVGSLLAPRLLESGHSVRALGRDRTRVSHALARTMPGGAAARIEIVRGDALTGTGLSDALSGVDVAYYLIHSMESASALPRGTRASRQEPTGPPRAARTFPERERIAADRFAKAAAHAGVRRVVYLGGLLPRAGESQPRSATSDAVSGHLASRSEVERILLDAVPDSVALRASIVIGARYRSFRLL